MKHTGYLHFITLMNLLHLPTSVNCPQDIISHIQVVNQLQVKLMHSLIRVWFLNPFQLPSSQCEAYSQHLYKCQCCFVVDCILQILFSSYPISLSFNQSLVAIIKKHFNQSTMSLLFYVILFYNFFALVFALIRVRKHWWGDITQGKNKGKLTCDKSSVFKGLRRI